MGLACFCEDKRFTKRSDMNKNNRGFGLILSTLLIDVAAMGMLIPVLPELLRGYFDGDYGRAAQFVGLFAALSAGLSFIFAPVMGALSDRFGRKPVLLLGLIGPAVSYFGLAMADNLAWYVIGLCVSGILGAIQSTINAYIADITPPEARAERFGMVGAAFGLGFIVGPLAGGLLGGLGLQVPFYVAGAITLLNMVLCALLLPESLVPDKRRAFTWANANPLGALRLLSRSKLLLALAACLFLSSLALQGMYSTFVLSMTLRFDWNTVAVGIVFTAIGVCTALSQTLLVGPIIKRLGERRSILLGLSVSALTFFAYALIPQGWMVYLVIIFASLGAVDEPAAQALLTSSVSEDEQGAVQGALTSLLSLTAVAGPLIATNVFAYFVAQDAPIYFPGAPLASGAVLIVLALLIAWRFVRPTRASAVSVVENMAVQGAGD
jgi:MFS transporter, DHA1 family, tetracycline resistance protein